MSIDWTIGWPKVKDIDPEMRAFMKRPDTQVIKEVLEDYLGELYDEINEHQPGFLSVKLKGAPSQMFARHGSYPNRGAGMQKERWFEVWVHKKGITITIRMQDDVTGALAENFARRCAQRWDGEINDPS